MITHYFTLLALSGEFRGTLTGLSVREVFTQVRDELVLTFAAGGTVRSLVLCLAPRRNAVFTREGVMRAKKNSADLFPSIVGMEVDRISLGEFSRVLTVGTGERELHVHLFNSAASNAFLTDRDGTVTDAFRGSGEFSGRPYPGVAGPPSSAPAAGVDEFLRACSSDRTGTLKDVLRELFPHLGPLYQKEVLFRAGADGTAPAGGTGDSLAGRIVSVPPEFLDEARRGEARIYSVPGRGEILSVVELTHLGTPSGTGRDVNAAVIELFTRRNRESRFGAARSGLSDILGKERRRIGRSLSEAEAIAGGESMELRYRMIGDLILTNLHHLRRGQAAADLPDPFAPGTTVSVSLDPVLSPAANADRYFEKARNARRAKEEARDRLPALRSRLEKVEALVGELEACTDLRCVEEVRKRVETDRDMKRAADPGGRLPFRIFPVGDHFEVWVGKSGAGNDLLTGKHAGPHDFWFHVRGAPGSHVVLKRTGGGKRPVPKEALIVAARIAAYYSKMRKGGMVPVAFCERKYVKKPKNAPPGTVMLQREEILFVEPSLP